ncbi:MAG: ParB/RepB/Spo0J family partition protein, partial [Roseiarcus sp.]
MADEAARHADHRPRLGRGLAALIGDAGEEPAAGRGAPRKAPIEFLRPNPRNPRKAFREDELDELAASIRERGVIQPVIVRPVPRVADAYEIIAGERRWRAAQRAGLHDIPIVV